jgi:hypothetical protein
VAVIWFNAAPPRVERGRYPHRGQNPSGGLSVFDGDGFIHEYFLPAALIAGLIAHALGRHVELLYAYLVIC